MRRTRHTSNCCKSHTVHFPHDGVSHAHPIPRPMLFFFPRCHLHDSVGLGSLSSYFLYILAISSLCCTYPNILAAALSRQWTFTAHLRRRHAYWRCRYDAEYGVRRLGSRIGQASHHCCLLASCRPPFPGASPTPGTSFVLPTTRYYVLTRHRITSSSWWSLLRPARALHYLVSRIFSLWSLLLIAEMR